MRFSVGVGLGPVRATQPIALPRSNRSRPGYMAQFAKAPACTIAHRTPETAARCRVCRASDESIRNMTPGGLLMFVSILSGVFGVIGLLIYGPLGVLAGVALVWAAFAAIMLALGALFLAFLVIASPILIPMAIHDHRKKQREVSAS